MKLSYNSIFLKFIVSSLLRRLAMTIMVINITQKNLSPKNNYRERRFVIYKGIVEASKVPQEWNAWLHHAIDTPPIVEKKLSWIKDHSPNLTGSPFAYEYKDNKKSKQIKNIYSTWSPDE